MNDKTRHAQASIRIATLLRQAARDHDSVRAFLTTLRLDPAVADYRKQTDDAKRTHPLIAIDLLRAIDTIIHDVVESEEVTP